MTNLSVVERKWLDQMLAGLTYSGNQEQLEQTLAMVISIRRKLNIPAESNAAQD